METLTLLVDDDICPDGALFTMASMLGGLSSFSCASPALCVVDWLDLDRGQLGSPPAVGRYVARHAWADLYTGLRVKPLALYLCECRAVFSRWTRLSNESAVVERMFLRTAPSLVEGHDMHRHCLGPFKMVPERQNPFVRRTSG